MATDSAKIDVIRLLAAKVETTTGTPIAVTGTDATYIIMNPQMGADQPNNEREAMAGKGQLASTAGPQSGTFTFEVELTGSGASGAVPDWATTFLPACDMTNTAGTFAFTNNVTTLTMVLYEDGLRRSISGAKGNFKIVAGNKKPARVQFEFKGIYQAVTDASILAPTFPTVLAPTTYVFTVGSFSPICSQVEIDAGNNVVMREDINGSLGYHAAAITQRKSTGTLDPEATAIATRDWAVKYTGSTEEAFSLAVGSTANNTITIAATAAQTMKAGRGSRNGITTDAISLQFNSTTPFSIAFT